MLETKPNPCCQCGVKCLFRFYALLLLLRSLTARLLPQQHEAEKNPSQTHEISYSPCNERPHMRSPLYVRNVSGLDGPRAKTI